MATVAFDSSTSTVNKNAGTKAIAVSLSAPAPAGGCSVQYNTADVTANSTTYGMGQNYTAVSNGTLSFAQDETSKNITITIANNPLFFPDITFTVTLSNPTNCTLGGTTVNTCTIHDNLAPYILFVDDSDGSLTAAGADEYTCVADGVTDDRYNFQALLDFLKANSGGVLYIPENKTILLDSWTQTADFYIGIWLPCRQKITIAGADKSTSKIQAGLVPIATIKSFHPIECGPQYARGATDYWIHATNDSPGSCFFNVCLDEDGPNQEYWGTWVREQCGMIDPSAYVGASFENKGRLKIFFHGCDIRNSLGDGISICENADVTIYDSTGQDCTRGIVDVIGGYSRVDLRDVYLYSTGACAIPIGGWPDYGGNSYPYDDGHRHDMSLHHESLSNQGWEGRWNGNEVIINNVYTENVLYFQDINYSPVYPSTWTFNNLTQAGVGGWRFEPWQTSGTGTVIEANNCSFLKRCFESGDIDKTGLVYGLCGTATFTDCVFDLGKNIYSGTWDDDWSNYQWWGTSGSFSISNLINSSITFNNCTFTVSDQSYEVQYATPALYLFNGNMTGSADIVINLNNVIFTGEHSRNLYAQNIGGIVHITGGTHPQPNGYGATPARFQFASGFYDLSVSFHDLHAANLGSGGKFILLNGNVYGSGKTITFNFSDNVKVPQSVNHIEFYQDHSPCYEGYILTGGRHIIAPDNTPPVTTTNGFPYDIYYLQNNQYYICNTIAYFANGNEVAGQLWDGPFASDVYSRGSYTSLPSDDANLTTLYSGTDMTNVATDDEIRVSESGNGYVLHEFKDVADPYATKMEILCDLQVALAPSAYTVYLQIYDRVTLGGMWVTVASDTTSGANVDFSLSFTLDSGSTPTFANCADTETREIASRIWQSNIPPA